MSLDRANHKLSRELNRSVRRRGKPGKDAVIAGVALLTVFGCFTLAAAIHNVVPLLIAPVVLVGVLLYWRVGMPPKN